MKSKKQTKPKPQGSPLIRWCVGAGALVYVLTLFVPYALPVAGGEVDRSWMQVLHFAFEHHLQWGRDIVFTFGPWGFLYGGYAPATHTLSMFAWVALALVFGWSAWRVARHLTSNAGFGGLWLLGFVCVAGLTITQNIDARLTAWSALLLVLHFSVEDRPSSPTQIALAVSLGLIGLIKFTLFLMAVLVVAVIAANTLLRYRKFPAVVLWFAASTLAFWLMAGQHLNALLPYLANSWRVASGFTEAMMWTPPEETQSIVLFFLVATPFLALCAYAVWARHRFLGALPLLAWSGIVFLVFKYGYVRHDVHMIPTALQLLVLTWSGVPMAWPVLERQRRWTGAVAWIPVAAALCLLGNTVGQFSTESLFLQVARTFRLENVTGLVCWSRSAEALRAALATESEQARNEYRIPPTTGDVDLYPFNQALILAFGLPYRPRPVIQSYSAYTPELAALNTRHLQTERAAQNILFEVKTIDGRFPSLDDGLSWPELLTRYDVKDATGPFLLLTRATEARTYRLLPLADMPIRFGERAAIPSMLEGPIWARLEMDESWSGRIISTAYKPTILFMDVIMRTGARAVFRLVPGEARAGFLLSPVVADCTSFAALASRDWQRDLADHEIATLTIWAANDAGTTSDYRSPMRLILQRLEFPSQDLSGVPGVRQLHNLR